MNMELLDAIRSPKDLRALPVEELPKVADAVRRRILETVSKLGGHLGSSLGSAEITVALHYTFDTPKDKLVWDTGHQTYGHKLLTGRQDRFGTIRQFRGLSGFLRRDESDYDAFGAGHASTAISAALGLAAARDLKGEKHKVVAIVSDGCMTGGESYEGLQNAGMLQSDLIVVLNDNQMFISNRVGACGTGADYSQVRTTKTVVYGHIARRCVYHELRDHEWRDSRRTALHQHGVLGLQLLETSHAGAYDDAHPGRIFFRKIKAGVIHRHFGGSKGVLHEGV